MTNAPLHVELPGFRVRENCLVVGDRLVTEVVASLGGAPVYLYDGDLIRKRVNELRDNLPEKVKIHYAIKANPMPAVVRLLSSLVDGLDVASGGELQIAKSCELDPKDISFAGPGKSDAEIELAIESGIVLNLESGNEMRRARLVAARLGKPAAIAFRVNPDFELKGSGMKMAGGPKPFGIDAEIVPELLQTVDQPEFDFRGFHIFSGSQNLSAQAICEVQEKTVELALELSRQSPVEPMSFNIGGGFGIPYFPGDERLDLELIGSNLARLSDRVESELPHVELVVELGRYLVGEAGVYVCEIVDKKVSRGHTYLVTNGGLHHHLAASGNFGQIIRKNYPVVIGNRINSDLLEEVSIVGPLCTPLDMIASNVTLPVADVGDLVVVCQSGAYGLSASPRGFLSHPDAKECLL